MLVIPTPVLERVDDLRKVLLAHAGARYGTLAVPRELREVRAFV